MQPAASPSSEAPEAERRALRGLHELGREQHEPVELSFRAYAEQTLRRTEAWSSPGPGRLSALERLAGADLYLSLACDHQRPGAWERLIAVYRVRLLALARRRGLRPDEAEERVDDLLGSMALPSPRGIGATRLGTFSGRGSLFAFLGTLLWRRHVDELRAKTRRRTQPLSPTTVDDLGLPPRDVDPYTAALGRELGALIATALPQALATCTPRERLVLVLKHRDGLPQNQIARVLGVGPPRISRLVEQGLARISAAMARLVPALQSSEASEAATWTILCERIRQVLATEGLPLRPPHVSEERATSKPRPAAGRPSPGSGTQER